jgi:DNA-binding HxlR family transcriptional regulator
MQLSVRQSHNVLARDYPNQDCSAASALEVVGERWTMLIFRDILAGHRRFDDLQRSLGIARNVLASRLDRLVEEGILEPRPYSERPPRFEYFLTEKGLDLWPVFIALLAWGDRHLAGPEGPTTAIEHKDCGGRMNDRRICERCGAHMTVRDARGVPGPGSTPRSLERWKRPHRAAA